VSEVTREDPVHVSVMAEQGHQGGSLARAVSLIREVATATCGVDWLLVRAGEGRDPRLTDHTEARPHELGTVASVKLGEQVTHVGLDR